MPLINGIIVAKKDGVNADEATATNTDILLGKTALVGKELITGTMKNNSGKLITGAFDSGGTNFIKGKIPESGFYDQDSILQIPVANLVSRNIVRGITIGGVTGTYTPPVNNRYIAPSNGIKYDCRAGGLCNSAGKTEVYPQTVSRSYNLALCHAGGGREMCILYFSGITLVTSFTMKWSSDRGQSNAYTFNAFTENSDGSYSIKNSSGYSITFTMTSSEITFISATSSIEVIVASW